MSGPIVRSAPSKKFTANWDSVFGGKKAGGAKAKSQAKPTARKTAKKRKG